MQTRSQVHASPSTLQTVAGGHSHWRAWALGAVLGSAALTGCAVVPAEPIYGYNGYGDVVSANVAPPAPYVETIPVAPFVGSVWIGGFWDWDGGRHVWRPGHYEHGRPGYAYRQPAWHQGPGGQWMLHRGGWEQGGRDGGRHR